MKLRKLAAAVVTAALGLSLATPALAADAADQRLTQVTQVVKTTLAVGDEYTDFSGEPNETPLGAQWSLHWSAEDKGLTVEATEGGKVLSLSVWDNENAAPARETFGPAFPAMTRSQARQAAADFLARVFTAGEEAVFDDDGRTDSLNAASHGFRGMIRLNGLSSPLSFYVRVRVSDGKVTSFWRDDVSQFVGDLPATASSTTAAKAAALLKDTLSLRLEYVLDGEKGKAVLRYLPEDTHDFYVDAATGELVDLTELREQLVQADAGGANRLYGTTAAAEAPEEAKADMAQLTDTELAGIAKLEGVLDKDALDKAVRRWRELSLGSFQLAEVSYRLEGEDTVRPLTAAVSAEGGEALPAGAKVTAHLTYVKKADDGLSRRRVTVDAKTGALESLWGYNAYLDQPAKLTEADAQAKAEEFLKLLWPGQFGRCERYSATAAVKRSDSYGFLFAQKVNGYFYPGNCISVKVSAADGSIMGVSKNFDDQVTFDDAEGIISAEEAVTAWAASYPVELAYLTVPVSLNLMGPQAKPLMDAGYSYYSALKPGYELGQRELWYSGVDAKTGRLVYDVPAGGEEAMTYSDLAGHWAQAAFEELAQYNVGWLGGAADPEGALTQLSCLALLASADGRTFSLTEEEGVEELYSYACRRGLIAKEERDEAKVLTRGEVVRMLLDSLGYKEIAKLQGIFRCDFADAGSIAEADLGYAALAQGLGLVHGDDGLNYAADRPATRAEAVVMLWQYMKR